MYTITAHKDPFFPGEDKVYTENSNARNFSDSNKKLNKIKHKCSLIIAFKKLQGTDNQKDKIKTKQIKAKKQKNRGKTTDLNTDPPLG